MRLRLSRILEVAVVRPPGYVEELLALGVIDGEWLEIPDDTQPALRKKYRGKSAKVKVRVKGSGTEGEVYRGARRIKGCGNCGQK